MSNIDILITSRQYTKKSIQIICKIIYIGQNKHSMPPSTILNMGAHHRSQN